ncbi:MAG: flagellar export protein FliJ, partial [Bacillales bacterium]
MKYAFKFDKILSLKEREKEEALLAYQDSIGKFEKVAKKLYELLRQKEKLQTTRSEKLKQGTPVNEIRFYEEYLESLEKKIEKQQIMVNNARNRMQHLQKQLMEKNIEVKKFEKLREKDARKFFDQLQAEENKRMDDA